MDIKQFKKFNKEKGKHFFEKETITFFDSKIESAFLDNKGHFITSEKFDENTPRLFTIRKANFKNGSVNTIGEFQGYKTKEKAISFLN